MPSNKVTYEQAPYLALKKIAKDRSSSYMRANWGDRNGQLPSKKWYYGNRVNFDLFNGTRLLGGIHKDAMCAFQAFNHELMLSDYHAISGQTWGGAYRNVRGSSKPSSHAFLVACDLSSSVNPMSSRFMTDMPVAMIRRIYSQVSVKSGHPVWVWGGAWTRRKDAMHFNLQVAPWELADGVRCSDGTVFTPDDKISFPSRSAGRRPTVFSMGSKHSQVKEIQRVLIKNGLLPAKSDDGAFGHQTEEAVKRWQTRLGLTADGVWGPATEEATRAYLSNKKPPRGTTIMKQPEAVAIIKRAYAIATGQEPSRKLITPYITRVRRGKLTLGQLVDLLRLTEDGKAWQQKRSALRVAEIREAVVAAHIEQFGTKPTPKQLTIGVTKVTSTLASAWT